MSAKEKKKTKQVQDDDPGRKSIKRIGKRSSLFKALQSPNVIEFNQMVKPFGQESYQTILQYVNGNTTDKRFYFVSGSFLDVLRRKINAYYLRKTKAYKDLNILLCLFYFSFAVHKIRTNKLSNSDFIVLSVIIMFCLGRNVNRFNSSDISTFCRKYYKTNYGDRYMRLKKLGFIISDPDPNSKHNHYVITSKVYSFARSIQNNLALFYNNEIDNIEDI